MKLHVDWLAFTRKQTLINSRSHTHVLFVTPMDPIAHSITYRTRTYSFCLFSFQLPVCELQHASTHSCINLNCCSFAAVCNCPSCNFVMTGSRSLLSDLAHCDIITINYPSALTPNYCLLTGETEIPLQFLHLISITTTTTTTTTATFNIVHPLSVKFWDWVCKKYKMQPHN
jgi:hypothetical protein